MPKAKKKTQVRKEEVMEDSTTGNDPNSPGKAGSTTSCSSIGSLGFGSVSMVEFLEAKIQWQDNLIKDLQAERNFLRDQVQEGNKRKALLSHEKMTENSPNSKNSHDDPKMSKVTTDDGEDDADVDGGDLPQSSPNISDSSDSDAPRRRTRSPPGAAAPGRSHVRVKGPDEAVRRYQRVLKTFGRVRTMTEAFRLNGVDRGTIKMTAPIAELKIVDPNTFNTLKFNQATDTLQSFAQKCASQITPEKRIIIEDMKSRGKLLPLLVKY